MNKWTKVEDALPELDIDVLTYCTDIWNTVHFYKVLWRDETTGEWSDGKNFSDKVIVWTHLPAHPMNVIAKWIKSDIMEEEFVCSLCGGAAWYYDHAGVVKKSAYCPNCGAAMILDDYEGKR